MGACGRQIKESELSVSLRDIMSAGGAGAEGMHVEAIFK